MSSTKPPSGTRDFLPDDVRRREYVVGVVRDVYERYGFEPLETPAFENIETLLGKYGDEGNKLIFKILRRGEHESSGKADLALRYDLTVPLARVVAHYQASLPRFFRRYQIQPVWRADRPGRGRFREFYQCDIDAVGSPSLVVEAELLSAVSEVLVRLGFGDFVVRVNHRLLLTALLELAGVEASQHADALTALDKLDKIGREGVAAELVERGLPGDVVHSSLDLFMQGADGSTGLEYLKRLVTGHTNGARAVETLVELVDLCGPGAAGSRLRIDPSLARGLSYYTGAIMEIAVSDLPGSLGGGGRYDNLIGMFLGRDVPACGFSLGLERIVVVMTERNMFPTAVSRGPVDVVVTFMVERLRRSAIGLAGELRARRVKAEVYPEEGRKLERVLKYAAGKRAPLLAILGEDEQARGEVTIRDLETRQQDSQARGDVGDAIARRLSMGDQ